MTNVSRRQFLGAAAAVAATGLISTPSLQAQEAAAETVAASASVYPPVLYKALITNVPTDEICEKWAAAGYEGMEVQNWNASLVEARKSRQIAEKHGMRVHSVMRAWTNLQKPESVDADVDSVKTASAYGADGILWVPCQLPGQKTPEPWDFEIDFDPKTLMIKSVVPGDNVPYAAYIENHNKATEASIKAIEQLIPVAAKEGVRIGIENVWNNMWNTPELFAAFCKYFDSPWVGCYFDLGNHTKYSRCEEWLSALGSCIFKLHIKDFKLDEVKGKRGGGPGKFIPISQGSIDWISVRKALANIPYTGWVTIESGGYSEAEHSQLLDKFFTGTPM